LLVAIGAQAVVLQPGDLLVTNINPPHDLLRVNPLTGQEVVVASGITAGRGIAVSQSGEVFALNLQFDSVVRVDPLTGAKTVISSGGLFSDVSCLAVEANGNLLVGDRGGAGSVVRVNPVTGAQSVLSSGGQLGGIEPTDIAVDAFGRIFMTHYTETPVLNENVSEIDPVTGALRVIKFSPFNFTGLGAGPLGDLLITVPPRLSRLNPDTGDLDFIYSGGVLSYPSDIVLGMDGNYYVVDSLAVGAIFRVDPLTGSLTALQPGNTRSFIGLAVFPFSTACSDGLDNDGDGLVDLDDPGCESPDDVSEQSTSLVCDDGVDNDGDGLVDLDDPGCESTDDSSEQSTSLICDDGIDNDGDGSVDLEDPGCATPDDPSEIGECQNGIDDDGDGSVDLDDPGCRDAADASEYSDTGECDDGTDNDGDGLVDLNDPGCESPDDLSEQSTSLVCDDGVDNDGDGLTDLTEDPGCDSVTDLTEIDDSGALVCDDGLDNDGDGLIDFGEDPGCGSVTDPAEEDPVCEDGLDNDNDGLIDWADPGCVTPDDELTPQLQCDDGRDNDGDGLVDSADPQCFSPYAARERYVACGLGSELVLLLAPLVWLHRRRRLPRGRLAASGR
jgi:hypothetical protein